MNYESIKIKSIFNDYEKAQKGMKEKLDNGEIGENSIEQYYKDSIDIERNLESLAARSNNGELTRAIITLYNSQKEISKYISRIAKETYKKNLK